MQAFVFSGWIPAIMMAVVALLITLVSRSRLAYREVTHGTLDSA
jgi:hypothetical protein